MEHKWNNSCIRSFGASLGILRMWPFYFPARSCDPVHQLQRDVPIFTSSGRTTIRSACLRWCTAPSSFTSSAPTTTPSRRPPSSSRSMRRGSTTTRSRSCSATSPRWPKIESAKSWLWISVREHWSSICCCWYHKGPRLILDSWGPLFWPRLERTANILEPNNACLMFIYNLGNLLACSQMYP